MTFVVKQGHRGDHSLKVLVTGASGFIASAIIEILQPGNFQVLACARSRKNIPTSSKVEFHEVDFSDYRSKSDWLSLLATIDIVINCAGILKEKRDGDFNIIHYEVPKALADACVETGVKKFIQISALGSIEDGEFIVSKYKFDQYLMDSSLVAIIIRPSVVISLRGSYGGTSLLRSLASLPFVILLPGKGDQRIQPILLEDLAGIVAKALEINHSGCKVLYAVGPEILSIKQFLALLRSWLKLPTPKFIGLPTFIVTLAAWLGQHFKAGPLGQTIRGMLERGNVGPDKSFDELMHFTGYIPHSISETLSCSASFVQDRWHARLYLLTAIVWLVLIFVWIMSGIAGFLASPSDYQPILQQLFVPDDYQRSLVFATSFLDVSLGVALLLRYKVRLVLWLMLFSVIGYTVLISFFVPSLWLEPLGSLLKNLPIILILLIYGIVEDMR